MIYDSPDIEEFFKGKVIHEPLNLPIPELKVLGVEEQQQKVLEALKKLDKQSLKGVVEWIKD